MKKPPRPKSKPINPLVFIVLGAAVLVYALVITWTVPNTNKNVMYIFAFIGGLFLIVGLIRHFQSKGESFSKEEREVATVLTNVSVTKPDPSKKTIILCPRCRSRNYSTSNYCHMCGARLR